MPATASNTVRNRRSSSADRRTGGAEVSSPITTANYRGPSGALRHLPINGEEVASPAPSASPPHRWGRRSPSGAFGATSPSMGTAQPLRRLRRHLPMNGEEHTKNEAAPAADTASTGRPPGDTRLVSAPLYGRCLLLEANLCVNCRRTRTENELTPQCDDPRTMSRGLSICRLLHLR